jgi:hypothetical protein
MIDVLIAVTTLGIAAEESNPKLCDPNKYVSQIEPDMQYTEEEFNYENYRWAMDWFRKADWKTRVEGKTYERPFELGWEFEMMYFNRLTAIEGYVLKQRALASEGETREVAVDRFCKFMISAVPLD